MIYLKSLRLLNDSEEYHIIMSKMNIHNNIYPLKIFAEKQLENIEFEPITIFYGGNGSGKTTILNIIADAVKASKRNIDKKGDLFQQYVKMTQFEEINRSECKIKNTLN